jgi:hypothetical protein
VAEVVVVENWQPWRVVLVYHHWVCFNLVLESAHFKPSYAFYSRRCVRVRVTVSGGRSFSLSTIPFCLVPLYILYPIDSVGQSVDDLVFPQIMDSRVPLGNCRVV